MQRVTTRVLYGDAFQVKTADTRPNFEEAAMKQLIFSVTPKDCDMQTFRSGGPGGQNQNKRDTGVRFIHRESGARGESREFRTQHENKRAAWLKMTKDVKFKIWLNRRMAQGPSPEELVAQDMDPKNIKVEVLNGGGQWVTI